MTLLGVAAGISAVMLAVACALTAVRLVRGPTTSDRAVATDVLVALVMAGLVVLVTVEGSPTFVPVLLVLSLLGFVGSATVARFVGRRDR